MGLFGLIGRLMEDIDKSSYLITSEDQTSLDQIPSFKVIRYNPSSTKGASRITTEKDALNPTQFAGIVLPEAYKRQFTFSIYIVVYIYIYIYIAQRLIEYRNFKYEFPDLLGVVIESFNTNIMEGQKMIGEFYYRMHLSPNLIFGQLADFIKIKVGSQTENGLESFTNQTKILFFFNNSLINESKLIYINV